VAFNCTSQRKGIIIEKVKGIFKITVFYVSSAFRIFCNEHKVVADQGISDFCKLSTC